MLEPFSIVLSALAAAAGSLVQGSVGFGFSLISAPLMALIDPRLVPGPATVASAALNLMTLYRTRGGPADWRGVRWAGAGLVPGTVAAGVMLAAMSAHFVAVTVGVLVLIAVLLSAAGITIRRSAGSMLTIGMVSGFMGTVATVGGPAMALAYQHDSGPVIRATLNRFFLAGTVITVAVLIPAGKLGPEHLLAGLAMVPGVAVGFLAAQRLHDRVDAGWARPAVLGMSAVSSIAVLVRELV
ncbi:MAG TPA: sulfite exporter TauE/SafE family protein [Actinomycetota bacterium]|nr:sulfite exporter TauE/SafE family protein [Actinomycetota bacterium]